MSDTVVAFQHEMELKRLGCPETLITDGKIHRFDVPGDKSNSKNGWYIAHHDEYPTITFGSWKTGETFTWSPKQPQDYSPIEQQCNQKRIAAAKEESARHREALAQEAATRAQDIWKAAVPAHSNHPYLRGKQVKTHEVRVHEGTLVIPIYGKSGAIATLQFIQEDGEKRFFLGGSVKGNYFLIGKPCKTIYVTEGFATAATVHEATGSYTIVAFDAGNLRSVAERIRREYPDASIIIAADNDSGTGGNPGLTKAKEAAEAVGGEVVYPRFKDMLGNGKPPTDFNDLFILESLDVVREQLHPEAKPENTPLRDALLNFPAMLSLKIPPRKLLYPFLPEDGSAMAYGARGVGKTFFDLSLAASLCTGTKFFRWNAPPPTGVLYVDGEMDIDELRNRMTALLPTPPKAPLIFLTSHQVYRILQRDLVLTNPKVQEEITAILDDNPELKVLILDNISCLFSGIDEDKKGHWEPIAAWLVRLRHRGVTILLVHHAGKGGQQRGTSGREDSLDTVIQLSKPVGYSQQEGCHFEIAFTKCRSAKGAELEPLDVKLSENNGQLEWTWKTLAVSKEEQAKTFFDEGVTSPTELAEEMGITRGYASKLLKKFRLAKGAA